MNRSMPLSLVLAVCIAPACAQQTASASFGPAPAASTASVEFGRPAHETSRCERTVPAPCSPPRSRKIVATLKKPVPKANPLAVHPEAAVRDTKAPEIALPGVMTIAGADAHALDFSRARVVEITNGGSQTVYVSSVDQNRIQLPWTNTKVVGTEELAVEKDPASNNVFVQFKEGVGRAVTIYFEQPGGPSVLALQMVPKEIAGQTILVRDSSLAGPAQRPVKGGDYVAATQSLMEQVALGGAPQRLFPDRLADRSDRAQWAGHHTAQALLIGRQGYLCLRRRQSGSGARDVTGEGIRRRHCAGDLDLARNR